MTPVQSLLAFTAAAGLLTLTPGVDTALVLRAATLEGRRPAAMAAAGIGLGCLIWGAAVSLGLAAVLTASATAFAALKWAGAIYLGWLGVRLILGPHRSIALEEGGPKGPGGRDALRRGLLTNLLNPKVGVFYLSFLPQFVPAGQDAALWCLLLATVHVGLSLVWFGVLIGATRSVSGWMQRPRVASALDRVAGCVFIAFGARLALASRA